MPWSMLLYESDSIKQIDDIYIEVADSLSNCDSSDSFLCEKSNENECCIFTMEICFYLLLIVTIIVTLFIVAYQYSLNSH